MAIFDILTRRNPDDLPGAREDRVFVGGQYDFLPTLRAIAQYVREIATDESPLVPILPIDYEIPVPETMDRDLEILGRCRYAIFDLSDLGAQLVEMQEARQKSTAIDTLLVYPVRERINEPERGRRTVLSFGLPHFGYKNLPELKSIVWRFLMDAPTESDLPPRFIHDPTLDCGIRKARAFASSGDRTEARRILKGIADDDRFMHALEPLLGLAQVEARDGNTERSYQYLEDAAELCRTDSDEAELHYYHAVVESQQEDYGEEPDWERMLASLDSALGSDEPGDARYRLLQGYSHARLGGADRAIEVFRLGLQDRNVPDPVVEINLMNNLAYLLCSKVESGDTDSRDEIEALTQYLVSYHEVFRRRKPEWLDTRAGVLLVLAKQNLANGSEELAQRRIEEAVELWDRALGYEEKESYTTRRGEAAEMLEDLA